MKYLKVILPMLAMIFAIGLTFATVDPEPKPEIPDNENYAIMYVHINGDWYDIEVDCKIGTSDCQVEFDEDPSPGTPYQVYNSEDLDDPAEGSAEIKELGGFPPTDD